MSNIAIKNQESFRIDVEDKPQRITMVFDKKYHIIGIPWQEVEKITETIDRVVRAVSHEFPAAIPKDIYLRERNQIAMAHKDGKVLLAIQWTDRLHYTSIAALVFVSEMLKQTALACQLAATRVSQENRSLISG